MIVVVLLFVIDMPMLFLRLLFDITIWHDASKSFTDPADIAKSVILLRRSLSYCSMTQAGTAAALEEYLIILYAAIIS